MVCARKKEIAITSSMWSIDKVESRVGNLTILSMKIIASSYASFTRNTYLYNEWADIAYDMMLPPLIRLPRRINYCVYDSIIVF